MPPSFPRSTSRPTINRPGIKPHGMEPHGNPRAVAREVRAPGAEGIPIEDLDKEEVTISRTKGMARDRIKYRCLKWYL